MYWVAVIAISLMLNVYGALYAHYRAFSWQMILATLGVWGSISFYAYQLRKK